MKTLEAVKHFGSVRELAAVLDISVQSVYYWEGTVPLLRQYQLQEISCGKLQVTPGRKRKPPKDAA